MLAHVAPCLIGAMLGRYVAAFGSFYVFSKHVTKHNVLEGKETRTMRKTHPMISMLGLRLRWAIELMLCVGPCYMLIVCCRHIGLY